MLLLTDSSYANNGAIAPILSILSNMTFSIVSWRLSKIDSLNIQLHSDRMNPLLQFLVEIGLNSIFKILFFICRLHH